MRHTARSRTRGTLLARKGRNHSGMRSLRSKISRMRPLALVKRNPYPSLGIALGLSAISGVAVWFMNHRR